MGCDRSQSGTGITLGDSFLFLVGVKKRCASRAVIQSATGPMEAESNSPFHDRKGPIIRGEIHRHCRSERLTFSLAIRY